MGRGFPLPYPALDNPSIPINLSIKHFSADQNRLTKKISKRLVFNKLFKRFVLDNVFPTICPGRCFSNNLSWTASWGLLGHS